MLHEAVLFLMVIVQCVAYVLFQRRAGIVSHKKYIACNLCFMVGQTAQAIDSALMGAWASLAVAVFFFLATAYGIIMRFLVQQNFIDVKADPSP